MFIQEGLEDQFHWNVTETNMSETIEYCLTMFFSTKGQFGTLYYLELSMCLPPGDHDQSIFRT